MISRQWLTFSCIAVGGFLAGINMSVVDVLVPAISATLDADTFAATWFVLAYSLATCAFILSFGRLADILGRKGIYVGGLIAMCIGALICGFADSSMLFVIGRAIQGLGSAMLLANSTALLVDVFPATRVSTALGLNVAIVAAAQSSGPLVAGFMEVTYGWRSIFLIVAGLALGGMLWGGIHLPRGRGRRSPFDFTGAALSVVALLLVLLALSRAPVTGWFDPVTIAIAASAVVAVAMFVVSQRLVPHPIVSPVVFSNRARTLALVSTFLMALPRGGLVLLVSLALQLLHGSTPLEAGQLAFVAAFALTVASPFAGVMVRLVGVQLLCLITPLIVLTGIALVLASGMEGGASVAGLVLVGVGTAWFMTPNTTAIMTTVETEHRGVTNGLRATFQTAGSAISAVMVMALLPIFVPIQARRDLLVQVPHQGSTHDQLVSGQNLVMVLLMAVCLAAVAIAAVRIRRSVAGDDR